MRNALLFSIALISLVPGVLFAHGSGASFESRSDQYVIDIGYDPDPPQAGERILLDATLLFADGNRTAEYDRVWMRLEVNKKTVVATGLAESSIGPTTLLVHVPSELNGDAILTARFEKDDQTIAEASFPFTIAPSSEKDSSPLYLMTVAILSGLVGGGVLSWSLFRRRTTRQGL